LNSMPPLPDETTWCGRAVNVVDWGTNDLRHAAWRLRRNKTSIDVRTPTSIGYRAPLRFPLPDPVVELSGRSDVKAHAEAACLIRQRESGHRGCADHTRAERALAGDPAAALHARRAARNCSSSCFPLSSRLLGDSSKNI
jgi:hypothetical protein